MLTDATKKQLARKYAEAVFSCAWFLVFLLPLYAGVTTFPINGSLGDIAYTAGRVFGLFGLLFLSFVISCRALFNPLKKALDPLRLNKSIVLVEVLGITGVLFHPLALVFGRYLIGYENPLEILIPNFSTWMHVFIARGCIAFWIIAVTGIAYLNRNSLRLNKYWSYIHMFLYPAFFIAAVHGFAIGSSMENPLISLFIQAMYYIVFFSLLYRLVEIMLARRREYFRNKGLP